MMVQERLQILPRAVLLAGLALWMSVAVFNNITDPGTNIIHLNTMLSMRLLSGDPDFGNGLEWRAWAGAPANMVLWGVIIWQLLTAAALWLAALQLFRAVTGKRAFDAGLPHANIALSMFLALWLFFLCGGLWFGYWMKQGAIQNVHMTLVIISVTSLIYVNQPLRPGSSPADASKRAGIS